MNKLQKLGTVAATVAMAIGLGLTGATTAMADTGSGNQVQPNYEPRGLRGINESTAAWMGRGQITFLDGSIDASIAGKRILNPYADDDGDGLRNNQEVYTYIQNNKYYVYYKSHPLLKDTDGDGLPDGSDPSKLSWDVHARDALLATELSYRDDDEVWKALTQPQDYYSPYDGRAEYRTINREMGPYWTLERSWHNDSGLDAILLKASNKKLPFLKEESHILAFRGTAGAKDLADDVNLLSGVWFDQQHETVALAKEIANQGITRLNVTGHSLGGFLTNAFMVRSVGKTPSDSYRGDNYNYWDKEKLDNKNIQKAYVFNAPSFNGLGWSDEYRKVSNLLGETGFIDAYQTNNDNVVPSSRFLPWANMVWYSAGKHSSRSFFEPQFTNVPGLSVGERREFIYGKYDKTLDQIEFIKPTTITLYNYSGRAVWQTTLTWKQSDVNGNYVTAVVPSQYQSQLSGKRMWYGENNSYYVR